MTQFYGKNASKIVAEPSELINVNEERGRVRRSYDEYVLLAEMAVNDIVGMSKIPKGAKIVDARMVMPAGGSTGSFEVGFASDSTALMGAQNFGAGAIDNKMAGTAAGYEAQLAQDEQIELKCTVVSDASIGDKVSLEVFYVLD